MDDLLSLGSDHIAVEIDLGRGADVLTLTHRGSGTSILFEAPWRERAEAVRHGLMPPTAADSFTGWLEQYRGGWQTLCPNAGAERPVAGGTVGFHGEASLARWEPVDAGVGHARLRTELFSVPVTIDRDLVLATDAAKLELADTVTNLSDVELEFDYAHHPALGGAFLDAACVLDTGAGLFTADPETAGNVAPAGSSHAWPAVTGPDGSVTDMRVVPPPGVARMAFGWLSDFDRGHWATVSNPDLGLTVRLSWDGACLPYAWLWQELNASAGFPWFRRARVLAIEPSSTQTSGPGRRSQLRLGPRQSIRIPISFAIEEQVTTREEPTP